MRHHLNSMIVVINNDDVAFLIDGDSSRILELAATASFTSKHSNDFPLSIPSIGLRDLEFSGFGLELRRDLKNDIFETWIASLKPRENLFELVPLSCE